MKLWQFNLRISKERMSEVSRTMNDRDVNNTTDHLEAVTTDVTRVNGGGVPYVVVLAGDSVGKVIRLDPQRAMRAGRTRECEICFDCENISREHAVFELQKNGKTLIKDLGSTNGTIVNGKKIKSATLQDGDRICLGNVILRYSIKDDLEFDFQQELYHKATRDALTGAFNKRYFMEIFYKEFSFHKRQKMPLSLIILDVDDFKRLNDTYGHVNGDIVLKSLASELMSCMRHEDVFARFGGEEFVAIFRFTPRETALTITNKLLELIRSLQFSTPTVEFTTSATFGVATLEEDNYESPEEMLMAADQKLYIGKSRGKNTVVG